MARYMLVCEDKQLALAAVSIVTSEIPGAQLVSTRTISGERVRDTLVVNVIRRDGARIILQIATGDPEADDDIGPFDGQCWLFVETGLSPFRWRANRKLANDACRALVAHGIEATDWDEGERKQNKSNRS